MSQIKIGNVSLGEGRVKICVSLMGKNITEIEKQAFNIIKHQPDIIEFRADHFESVLDKAKVISVMQTLKKGVLKDYPVIFTIRTKNEGGEIAISYDAYKEILVSVAESNLVEAIDVEVNFDEDTKNLIAKIRDYGVTVIGSNHNFERTPEMAELASGFGKIVDSGADVVKMAVMPKSPRDVLNLMEATLAANERYIGKPFITMSMGRLGVTTRMAGELFGSVMTFAAAGKASAPGQIDIEDLRMILNNM